MSAGADSFSELIRRAQLLKQLKFTPDVSQASPLPSQPQPQGQVQPPTQAQQIQAAPPNTQQITPRDVAQGEYQTALAQPPPNIAQYHPSLGRRIAAMALGAVGGMHDPRTGYEVGHGIAYAPFEKQQELYKQNLAQKGAQYQAASEEEQSKAKIAEETSKNQAELARAEAEKARKESEEETKKKTAFEASPEGREFELKKLEIQHPPKPLRATPLEGPFDIELKSGEKLSGITYDRDEGQYYNPDTKQFIPTRDIKPGTEKKSGPEKPPAAPPKAGTPFEAKYNDYVQTHNGQPPTGKDLDDIIKASSSEQRTTQDREAEWRRIDTNKTRVSRIHDNNLKSANDQLDKIVETESMLTNPTAESAKLAIPKILTALVSGQGSGVRITQPEQNAIAKATGIAGTLQNWLNTTKGLPSLNPEQIKQLLSILQGVKSIITKKRDVANNAIDAINGANSIDDINKADSMARRAYDNVPPDVGQQNQPKVIDYVKNPKTGRYVPSGGPQ